MGSLEAGVPSGSCGPILTLLCALGSYARLGLSFLTGKTKYLFQRSGFINNLEHSLFSRKILYFILIYEPDEVGVAQLFVMGEGPEQHPLNWSGPREPWGR